MADLRRRLALAAAFLVVATAAPAQISPGPLAKPHAALEGSLKCAQCHAGRKEEMAQACLSCHREIAALSRQDRGFHTRDKVGECAACHPDHAGRDFDMVSWPGGSAERFDHRRAGWALEQSHATTKCADCHAPKHRVSRVVALAPSKGGRWTGLETACVACHDDVHRGQLDRDCASCHDAGKWPAAPGFDHERTRYPLTGAHDSVTCNDCHLPKKGATVTLAANGAPQPVYRNLPFAECSSCHADPHTGKFGAKCAACHVTSSFRKIDKSTFDHDRTRYPLRGDHQVVACAKCHAPGEAGKKPPFAQCADCHRQDPHAGTATLAGATVDCVSCHGVDGWTPSTMTLAAHGRSRYPLEGRHQSVKCAACHQKQPAGVVNAALGTAGVQLRPAFGACRDCHADDHGGQLASRADRGACASCHTVAGWVPSSYGRPEHAKLRLALAGKHADAKCAACHGADRKDLPAFPNVAALGKARVAVRLDRAECASCHVDVHEGRYEKGPRAVKEGCAACHDARAFRPSTMAMTAHARDVFPLEGGHRATPCVACHADLERRGAPGSFLLLARQPARGPLTLAVPKRACLDCHAKASPHGDQFTHRTDGGACEGCHSAATFAPADRFDHDEDAGFSLAGAHAKVACAKCHVPASGDAKRVRYRPLSAKCESCHDDATAQRTTRGGR